MGEKNSWKSAPKKSSALTTEEDQARSKNRELGKRVEDSREKKQFQVGRNKRGGWKKRKNAIPIKKQEIQNCRGSIKGEGKKGSTRGSSDTVGKHQNRGARRKRNVGGLKEKHAKKNRKLGGEALPRDKTRKPQDKGNTQSELKKLTGEKENGNKK